MRITHPRPELGAQSDFGVDFIDGVATVDSLHPERELALLQHGFTIEKDLEVEEPYHGGLGEPILDLTTLTKAQLKAIANDEGIEIPARATQADMVALIAAQPPLALPDAVQNEDGSFTIVGEPVSDEDATDGPFATFERPDGTVVGDGTSIVTLHDDGTATVED